jgi:hypothetical protein
MARSTGKTPAEQFRAGDIDLTELNRLAAEAGDAATSADAVNPPDGGSGLKSITTSDT